MPRAAAASIAAIPNPPLCDGEADAPGRRRDGRDGRVERDLGPRARDAEASPGRPCACPRRGRRRAARRPVARRPAVSTTSARTPLAAHARAASTTASAGHGDHRELDVALDARERTRRVDEMHRPREAPRRAGCARPRRRRSRPPDAPITATEDGRRTCATAATSAVRWRSSKRCRAVRRQRGRELELDLALGPARDDREAGVVEHPEHPAVLRQDGRGERVDALAATAACARWASSTVAIPWPCQASATANATSARPGAARDVGAVPDDGALGAAQREQRQPVAGVRGAAGGVVEVHAGAEEAEPARLVRQRGEERAQARHVRGRRRPHVHGRAVAEDDVGLDGRHRPRSSQPGPSGWELLTRSRGPTGCRRAGASPRVQACTRNSASTASAAPAARCSAPRTSRAPTSSGSASTTSWTSRCSRTCCATTRSTGRSRARSRCSTAPSASTATEIPVFAETDPADLPWGDLGADVVDRVQRLLPRPRGRRQAPRGRRAQGDHLRAGQGARRHRRAGHQLRDRLRPRAPPHHLQRVLHDQLPGPRGQGARTRRSASATA